MKKRIYLFLMMTLLCLAGVVFSSVRVEAGTASGQKKEYMQVLSRLIREGTARKNLTLYEGIFDTKAGRKALRQAVIQNRAALMAEGIDFLDSNWDRYYVVEETGGKVMFNSTKSYSRRMYRERYQDIMEGLEEVLACVEPSMTDADKAMVVYYTLAKNTSYVESMDCHTGYDVLVRHTGVCDGFANAYALAMNTLGIRCAVVSNYSRDHSWNLVKIGGQWYFCDLTNGIGTGDNDGMVVSYSSCLVGIESFLSSHPGYTMEDIYGEGNSDSLNIRKLPLAYSDYIPSRSAIRAGISAKTCMFYHKGYWYWISTGNMLKKSRLNGREETTVYIPADDTYIGWAEEYNEEIYLSLNDTIWKMDYKGNLKERVYQVMESEYRHAVSSYFWQLAYVGRFYRSEEGTLGYYITDLNRVRKGTGRIPLAHAGKPYGKPKLSAKKLTLSAGHGAQMYVMWTTPAGARSLYWKSSRPSVASVDQNGYIKAKKSGTAVISVRIGDKTRKCTVRVTGGTVSQMTVKKAR